MGISPFMAFAKGAFEGYNDIQEENRALAAEMAVQAQKDAASAVPSRMFQVMGSYGMVDLFPLSAAGDYDYKELLNEDIRVATQYLTKKGRAELGIDSDPILAKNTDDRVELLMQRYVKNNIEKKGPDDSVLVLPREHSNTMLFGHDVYGEMWKQVVKNGISEQGMADQAQPGTVLAIQETPNGDITGTPKVINGNTYGWMWDQKTQQRVEMTPDIFETKWTARQNERREKIVSPGFYLNVIGTKTIRLYETEIVASNQQDSEYLISQFGLRGSKKPYVSFGDLMERFVTARIGDPETVRIFNESIENYNTNQPQKYKITQEDLYKGFRLASPGRVVDITVAGTEVGGSTKDFINRQFNMNLSKLAIRADAGQSVIETTKYMKNNVTSFEKENGYFPPITQLLGGPVTLIAGLKGSGGILAQISGFVGNLGTKYNLDTELKVLDKMSKYAKAADAETRIGLVRTGVETDRSVRTASTTARHRFYKYMLAYQLAVAIQGGTGGRTVSDQDVENMLNAIGDRLFENGRVQLAVLDIIQDFAQNIVDKNKYWSVAGDSIDAAYAADAMNRFTYGGIDIMATTSERTLIAGEKLQSKLNDLPAQLDGPINTVEHGGLQKLLVLAKLDTEEQARDNPRTYTRDAIGFQSMMTDFANIPGRLHILTVDEYQSAVARLFPEGTENYRRYIERYNEEYTDRYRWIQENKGN